MVHQQHQCLLLQNQVRETRLCTEQYRSGIDGKLKRQAGRRRRVVGNRSGRGCALCLALQLLLNMADLTKRSALCNVRGAIASRLAASTNTTYLTEQQAPAAFAGEPAPAVPVPASFQMLPGLLLVSETAWLAWCHPSSHWAVLFIPTAQNILHRQEPHVQEGGNASEHTQSAAASHSNVKLVVAADTLQAHAALLQTVFADAPALGAVMVCSPPHQSSCGCLMPRRLLWLLCGLES